MRPLNDKSQPESVWVPEENERRPWRPRPSRPSALLLWGPLSWSLFNTLLGFLLIVLGSVTSVYKVLMGSMIFISSVMALFEWFDYYTKLRGEDEDSEDD